MKKMKRILLFFPVIVLVTSLYGNTGIAQDIETLWVWIALFALGVIGILILFVSSKQMTKIEKLHQEMLEKQMEIEQTQSLFLANMSENIHDIIEKTYKKVPMKDAEVFHTEVLKGKRLIDVTNDLIEFLRLKSKKVEITHEKFNLNNVLNEVSGSVCSKFKGHSAELIFDIDNNIPRYLIGDSLNLEKTLHNLLEYMLSQTAYGEITLEISMFGNYEERIELQFKLTDMGKGLSEEEIDTLFIPVYNEERKEYRGLGLFVAKELVTMMGGELAVQSILGKGTTFAVTLPFEMLDPNNRRNYRLPEKGLTAKKVFIVDRNYNSVLAIKKMFAYFKHDVKVMSKEEFLKHMPKLTPYDIVILDESLFNVRIIEYLETLKDEKDLKVIALNSLLEKDEESEMDKVVDKILTKPLNQERIFELILNLYTLKQIKEEYAEEAETKVCALTHQGEIHEAANISQTSFKDFSGMRLLIVEDDVINQKVLSNILKVSGIVITIANNGREAVNIIKESSEPFDLVLMDINMPVMDGYVATQMIRLESEYDDLPIVAFTALALESEREKIFNSGMNAYLTKPLNIGKLYTVFKMYRDTHNSEISEDEKEHKISKEILDVKRGIAYANNNAGFYIEILKEFNDAYGKSAELFAKLVREYRYEQIKMLCLDMKGLTGTIGAKEMFGLIIEIHQKILYHQEDVLVNYVERYEESLKRLMEEIRRYVSQE
jgi:CheY-like chemotaxis protein